MSDMSQFTKTILEQKYLWKEKGETEWKNIAYRVTKNVLKSVGLSMNSTIAKELYQAILERKFIPGGRYLYASGRQYHQIQNCLLLKAEDSREGWADLMRKISQSLMTGAGIGVDYSDIRAEGKPIRKTGGTATGPTALMQMVNEAGRGIMQGGSRRSAIWAGLNWKHPDVQKFVTLKNWSEDVKKLKEKDFNFPATLDGTNVSVQLDDEFFEAFHDEKNVLHTYAQSVYWTTIRQMLKTGEPGFSVDTGKNKKETLRNACVTGDTEILTKDGYYNIEDLAYKEIEIWNGFEWSTVTPKLTGENREIVTVSLSDGRFLNCTKDHKFVIVKDYHGTTERINAEDLKPGMKLLKNEFPIIEHGLELKDAYTNGFISAEGMELHKTVYIYKPKEMCLKRLENVHLQKWEEGNKRYRVTLKYTPMSKSFVPIEYNLKSKIEWLSGLFDGDGTELKEGGLQLISVNRIFLDDLQKLLTTLGVQSKIVAAQKAGFRKLPDHKGGLKDYYCQKADRICIGAKQIQQLKSLGLKCERMEFNKNPNRDASQFVTVVSVIENGIAEKVYCFNEPKKHLGTFNGIVTGQCTEVTSETDSDICNLGSINLARINSLEEMKKITELATALLVAGTVYSDVPYPQVDQVRTKNRRLGLGLMGIHEWLLIRGKKYGPDEELAKYLEEYEKSTKYAHKYCDEWDLSRSVKTRAIAPTGSIGIIAETTTGIEPIFCVAYKRRYLKHTTWNYQYVIDPTAKRLIDQGVNPSLIEDAYALAEDVERRVAMQAWTQKYVDHAISSTINLPAWGSELNNENKVQDFGNMLIKYLPNLRGITVYPDGSRGGQPLTPVKYEEAIKQTGQIFLENSDVCDITKGGSCGS